MAHVNRLFLNTVFLTILLIWIVKYFSISSLCLILISCMVFNLKTQVFSQKRILMGNTKFNFAQLRHLKDCFPPVRL